MADPLTAFFASLGSGLLAGTTAGAALVMYAEGFAYATLVAGSVAYGKYRQRSAEQKAKNRFNANLRDREQVIRAPAMPSPRIYGRAKVGGQIVHAQTTGTKSEFMHLVIAHCAHECDAFEEVWLGDVKLPDENPTTGMIESGEFAKALKPLAGQVEAYADGSGIVTLPEIAESVQSVTDGGYRPSDSYNNYSFSHTPGTDQVTGLTPGYYYSITYRITNTKSLIRVRKHLGAPGQAADQDLIDESGGKWTSSDKGTSVTYTYLRYEYDQDTFGQIGLPMPTVVLRGAKVYDPRTETTVWSDNNALCAADYLKNATFGIGASSAEVPDEEVETAANACDELVTLYSGTVDVTNGSAEVVCTGWTEKVALGAYFVGPDSGQYEITAIDTGSPNHITISPVYAGGTTTGSFSVKQKRYTCNGALSTADDRWSNLSDLADSMAGSVVWVQGRWLIRAGAYAAPTVTIDEDSLADGDISISPRRGLSDLFNGAVGSYVDRRAGYTEDKYPAFTSATYEAEDGEQLLATLDLPLTDNHVMCQRLAKIYVLQARQALSVDLITNLEAYDVAPSDTVELSLHEFGWDTPKEFTVHKRSYAMGGKIGYALQETSDLIWDWNTNEADYPDLAPNTQLKSAFTAPPALTGLSAESGTDQLVVSATGTLLTRVLVSWDQSTDAFVTEGGRIEVVWKYLPESVWSSVDSVSGDSTSTYVNGPADGKIITVAMRAVNGVGAAGYWSYINHTVLGKTEPPSDVTGLTATVTPTGVIISWDKPTDADYDLTELRAAPVLEWTNSSDQPITWANSASQTIYFTTDIFNGTWQEASLLFAGRALSYSWLAPYPGDHTVWAKNFDTSDNESANAAAVNFTVTAEDYQQWLSIIQVGTVNLIDASSWVVGTSGTQGSSPHRFVGRGDPSTEDAIVLDSAPDGIVRPMWRATSSEDVYDDSAGSSDGGWATDGFGVAENKMYRFTVWIRASGTMGGFAYLGGGPFTTIPSGAVQGYDYFAIMPRSSMISGRWYLFVGYVYPSSYGGSQLAGSGVYDGVTGQKVASSTAQDFRWAVGQTGVFQMSLLYYASTGAVQDFWGPEVRVCDGTEPSLDTLLSVSMNPRIGGLEGTYFVAGSGDVQILGRQITRVAGGGDWDAQVYSRDGFEGGAYASATVQTVALMFGLNTDPQSSAGYLDLDYVFYADVNSNLYAYESGSAQNLSTTVSATDVLAISYDGTKVRYFKNGTVLREVAVAITDPLYFDSSFLSLGARLGNVAFGPMTNNYWTSIGNRPQNYRAISYGASDTQHPATAGLYDESAASIASYGRSYTVDVFNRSTGALTSSTTYDVYGDAGNATTMASALNALTPGSIVCVRSHDEPQANRLVNGLQAAMERCGASKGVYGSPLFKYRAAYILVGVVGCGEGNGFEAYQGSVDSDTNAWCDVAFSIHNGNLNVTGTTAVPRTLGDYSYTGALDATRNVVTYSASEPGSPINGDLWCDTSSNPAVWKIYVSGSWQSASNLTTNTNQLTDGASLGSTALWTGVSGTGKPVDNATRNIVTYSGSAPGSPADGDIWVDTSSLPYTTYLRVSSAWVLSANAGTTSQALNIDPFTTRLEHWQWVQSGTFTIQTISDAPSGATVIRSNTGTDSVQPFSEPIQFNPSKTYRVRGFARRDANANGTFYLVVRLLDSSGSNITGDGSYWYYPASGVTLTTSWVLYQGLFGANTSKTFPSNARKMQVGAILNYGGSAGYMEVTDLRIEEAVDTLLVVPEAITYVDEATDASGSSGSPGYYYSCAVSLSLSEDATVIVTGIERIYGTSGGAGNDFYARAQLRLDYSTNYTIQVCSKPSMASGEYYESNVMVTKTMSLSAGSHTLQLGFTEVEPQSEVGVDCDYMSLRCEVIYR